MLTQMLNTDSPRARFFWGVLGVVVLAQLVGIYMLCSEQVRQKHARETEIQMQRMAVSDCLQYMPNATIASCNRQAAVRTFDDGARAAMAQASPQRDSQSVMATAVPVNFSFR